MFSLYHDLSGQRKSPVDVDQSIQPKETQREAHRSQSESHFEGTLRWSAARIRIILQLCQNIVVHSEAWLRISEEFTDGRVSSFAQENGFRLRLASDCENVQEQSRRGKTDPVEEERVDREQRQRPLPQCDHFETLDKRRKINIAKQNTVLLLFSTVVTLNRIDFSSLPVLM